MAEMCSVDQRCSRKAIERRRGQHKSRRGVTTAVISFYLLTFIDGLSRLVVSFLRCRRTKEDTCRRGEIPLGAAGG
jgi:hypothetical protein